MCNIFSGHIVIDKKHKEWGKVIFLSGIHHEKDRNKIYETHGKDIKLLAWESEEKLSLTKFEFTHSEGDISEKEKKEYAKILLDWAKKQNKEALIFDKFLTVLKKNKPLGRDKYSFDPETLTLSTRENNVEIICPELYDCTFKTGSGCTFTTGYGCTFKTGYDCTFTTGSICTFTTGSGCTFATDYGCVVVRRDVYEIIEIPKATIKLNKYGVKGYETVEGQNG